ncbi:hypothetical protein HDU81_010794 [Chytriomyces hyalinus]|nr:hypothetical protein HDU81_010794 [Chytriomyces hyalinus]
MNTEQAAPAPALGSAELRSLFALDPEYVATNHGSFGTSPRAVLQTRLDKMYDIESNPDYFMKITFDAELDDALLPVAKLLGLETVADVVFIVNATTGVNSVLRSLKQILKASGRPAPSPKQKILCFSSVYGNVLNGINYTTTNDGFGILNVDIPIPISEADLLDRVDTVIESERAQGCDVVLAVYDMISSVPGVIVPVERLTALFKSRGVLTCIDAAHAIGQVPIDLKVIQPDFFVSNLHKWLYVPRGCAVFYVAPRFQGVIHHPVISESKPLNWRREFHWVGTTDVSAYLCINAALKFRTWIGGEAAIMDYSHNLAVRGGQIVADILGTRVLKGVGPGEDTDGDAFYAAMVNVLVPDTEIVRQGGDAFMTGLQAKLLKEDKVGVAPYKYGGVYWIRLSAQVYLNEDDFVVVGNTLKRVLGV